MLRTLYHEPILGNVLAVLSLIARIGKHEVPGPAAAIDDVCFSIVQCSDNVVASPAGSTNAPTLASIVTRPIPRMSDV